MSLYSFSTMGQMEPYLGMEWLLTNGLGAFSSSTVVGCNTRRYHGLLCAATLPPVGRMMALNRIGEILTLDGKSDPLLELSVSQFGQNFHPRGDRYLRQFEIDDVAKWKYVVEGVTVTKEILLLWMQNAVAIRYTIEPDRPRPVVLSLLPFVSLRDFHGLRRGDDGKRMGVQVRENHVTVEDEQRFVHMRAEGARFVHDEDWWFGQTYELETERGLDDTEDLFLPGRFILQSNGKASLTLVASAASLEAFDWSVELEKRKAARTRPAKGSSVTIQRLYRAADDFIVDRRSPDGSHGATVLAGFPWFADWGRDTMISLPGLLLVTNRFKQAARVLGVFAQYVSEGMIPNRFDDYNNEPHYNTVDASLWFIHACYEYLRLSGDKELFNKQLLPACQAIVKGYSDGTRFHIKMDPADGLITQGDPHTQLTWMDAKCGDIAFTPRQGKAIEINALWYHALKLMGMEELATKVGKSLKQTFWISPFRGCYDVVDGGRKDNAIRPNQIFAVSLAHSALSEPQQRSVVEVVRRELLTPFGLRTLSAEDKHFHGSYTGNQMKRDEAYHNGTVWAWPIGAFLEAYLKVNNRSDESREQARQWLTPLIDSLESGCVGQLSEIFEGDPPHRPVGCYAQAWSVAEVLRLAVELEM